MGLEDNKQNLKPLPDKWRKKFSTSKPGKYYFYNVKTKETSWILPEGALFEESSCNSERKIKAPSKRDTKSYIPPRANEDKKTVQPRLSKEATVVLQGSKLNDDTAVQLEDTRKFCPTVSNDSTDISPSQNEKRELEESFSIQAKKAKSFPTVPATRQNILSQVDSTSIPHSIKKRRKRKKKKNIIESTANASSQFASSGTNSKNSELSVVELEENDASCRTGKYGTISKNHMISLCHNIVSAPCESHTKKPENAQCFKPVNIEKTKEKLPKQNLQMICVGKKRPFPLSHKLHNQHSVVSFTPLCSSTDATASNVTSSANTGQLVKDHRDVSQTELSSSQRSPLPVIGNILSSSTQNVPMKLEVADNLKKVAGNEKDISNEKINKTPAQAQLKRLQRPHQCSSTQPMKNRLAQLQNKLKSNQILDRILKDNMMPVKNEVDVNSLLSSVPNYVPNSQESMDIEYMESEVLEDIDILRQEDRRDLSHPIMFMEVDMDFSMSHSDSLYVVLDTNILLSHLKFVEGLRDTILPGNVIIHLYLPWQVLQELDHLKDKGKSKIQMLARSAIKFLYDNFSHKHPRVCGQKLSEATKCGFSCPDDIILRSCIELKTEGYPVVLLSNDINLLNKALVCDVEAMTKDQFVKQLNDNPVTLNNRLSSSVQDETLETTSTSPSCNLRDVVLCEMKAVVKDTLTQVLGKGMEDEYGHLWKKRTIISPPWEIDDVLHCLSHHWFALCDEFIPNSVRETISKLRYLMKIVSKGGGAGTLNLIESLELIASLFQALCTKYRGTVQVAIENIEALKSKLDKDSSVTELVKVPEHSDQLLENQCTMVLLCFEQAHSAAQSICNLESFSDPEWIPKAQAMLQSVQQLICLIKLVLSLPIESLNDQNPGLNELVHLIKGASSITSTDLAEFCKQKQNRILLENGIQQFMSFELLLSNKLQSYLI